MKWFHSVFLILAFSCSAVDAQRMLQSDMPIEKEIAIKEKLDKLNKPAIKTFQGEDGDVIDCVDIYKQPAFDHPLLKDHKIEMSPSEETVKKVAEIYSMQTLNVLPTQLWGQNESCLEGTVPILRVQRHHLLQTSSIENYGRKRWHGTIRKEVRSFNHSYPVDLDRLHELSLLLGAGFSYIGATAEISVYNPRVEVKDEYSSGQIWLRNGPLTNSDSIEVGWIVNPGLYGDDYARFFIYWTKDSSVSTGCFNNICPGFIQTSSNALLGSKLSPISSPGGNQYILMPVVIMDLKSYDKWWVYVQGKVVGYWPVEIFGDGGLGKAASIALFGGDVYSPRMKKQPPHTATQMGSGWFANYHWGSAAFFRKPRVMGYSKSYDYPDPGQTVSTHTNCYSAENFADVRFTEPLFYFGGPGSFRNMYCP